MAHFGFIYRGSLSCDRIHSFEERIECWKRLESACWTIPYHQKESTSDVRDSVFVYCIHCIFQIKHCVSFRFISILQFSNLLFYSIVAENVQIFVQTSTFFKEHFESFANLNTLSLFLSVNFCLIWMNEFSYQQWLYCTPRLTNKLLKLLGIKSILIYQYYVTQYKIDQIMMN
jgi:hypothetical protein